MKKQKKQILFFGLLCISMFFSCDFNLNSQKNPSNPEENPIEQILETQPVVTMGTVSKPITDDTGNVSLTCEDSNGGLYTFEQKETVQKSITSSNTWKYELDGIIKFSGSFSGSISGNFSSLSLTVEKAADSSGKLQITTEPVAFNFDVSEDSFQATIPAVQIKIIVNDTKEEIPEEQSTVTTKYMEYGGMKYCFTFYSDKTMKLTCEYSTSTESSIDVVDFVWNVSFVGGIGTYEGNPLEDGIIEINFDSMIQGGKWWDTVMEALQEAYSNGEKSKNVNFGNDLIDKYGFQDSYSAEISGDRITLLEESGPQASESVINDDGSTSFVLILKGDCADECIGKYELIDDKNIVYSFREEVDFEFSTETKISETPYIRFWLYHKDNEEIVLNFNIDIQSGYKSIYEVELEKKEIQVQIQGDTSLIKNPLIYTRAGSGDTITSYSDKLEIYYAKESIFVIPIQIFEDVDQNGEYNSRIDYPMSEAVDFYIDETNFTIQIYESKPSKLEKNIYFDYSDSDKTYQEILTEEQLKHFGFYESNNTIYFYIPIEEGTDGDILDCPDSRGCEDGCNSGSHSSVLLDKVFPFEQVKFHDYYEYQNSNLIKGFSDIVKYLETRKGFTVFGKELIGLE